MLPDVVTPEIAGAEADAVDRLALGVVDVGHAVIAADGDDHARGAAQVARAARVPGGAHAHDADAVAGGKGGRRGGCHRMALGQCVQQLRGACRVRGARRRLPGGQPLGPGVNLRVRQHPDLDQCLLGLVQPLLVVAGLEVPRMADPLDRVAEGVRRTRWR